MGNRIYRGTGAAATLSLGLLLAGCGGGGSGGGAGSGTLTVAITDAPVDEVTEVVVEFTGVSVKPKEGPPLEFTLASPRSIDLRSLTGDNSELLLDGVEVPAGEYNWLRLHVNAEIDGTLDSYVMREDGGQFELRVPSGGSSGLQLVRGFTVLAGGDTAFVIDWNLRQGLVRPPGLGGSYLLQPALRIVDMAEYGAIAGTVDAALTADPACTSDPNTGAGNAVYVYSGAGIVPDDIDGNEPDPLTTAEVRYNGASGSWEYRASFLPVGSYTVAFTCQAADDRVPDPTAPGEDYSDLIDFTAGQDAEVTVGQVTTIDF
jgi:hypothetical protein